MVPEDVSGRLVVLESLHVIALVEFRRERPTQCQTFTRVVRRDLLVVHGEQTGPIYNGKETLILIEWGSQRFLLNCLLSFKWIERWVQNCGSDRGPRLVFPSLG